MERWLRIVGGICSTSGLDASAASPPISRAGRDRRLRISPRWMRHPRIKPRSAAMSSARRSTTSRVSWHAVRLRWRVASLIDEAFHAQRALLVEPDLVVARGCRHAGWALAADLDFAAAGVDLDDLERFQQVGDPGGQPLAPAR